MTRVVCVHSPTSKAHAPFSLLCVRPPHTPQHTHYAALLVVLKGCENKVNKTALLAFALRAWTCRACFQRSVTHDRPMLTFRRRVMLVPCGPNSWYTPTHLLHASALSPRSTHRHNTNPSAARSNQEKARQSPARRELKLLSFLLLPHPPNYYVRVHAPSTLHARLTFPSPLSMHIQASCPPSLAWVGAAVVAAGVATEEGEAAATPGLLRRLLPQGGSATSNLLSSSTKLPSRSGNQ